MRYDMNIDKLIEHVTFVEGDTPTITANGDTSNEWDVIITTPEEVVVATEHTIQLYIHGVDIRAYVYPNIHLIYNNGVFSPAIHLYDTYTDDGVTLVKSYVGQPHVSNECKDTTLLSGVMVDDVLTDMVCNHTVMEEAIWQLQNDIKIQISPDNVETLIRCGYDVNHTVAVRVYNLKAYVLLTDNMIRGVTMCDSRHEAEYMLNRITTASRIRKIKQLDEGDLLHR